MEQNGDLPVHEQCTAHSGQVTKSNLIIVLLSTVLALTGFNVMLTFGAKTDIAGYTSRFAANEVSLKAVADDVKDLKLEVERLKRLSDDKRLLDEKP